MQSSVQTARKKRITVPLFVIAVFLFLWIFPVGGTAVYLENVPSVVYQPDGTKLSCYASGDESFNYLHDASGSLILQDGDGWYTYAVNQGGRPAASAERVGSSLRDAPRAARMKAEEIDFAANQDLIAQFPQEEIPFLNGEPQSAGKTQLPQKAKARSAQTSDKIANLVVFVRFQGEEEFVFGSAQEPISSIPPFEQSGGVTSLNLSQEYGEVNRYIQKISKNALGINTAFLTADASGTTAISYEDSHPRSYYKAFDKENNPNGYPESERVSREMTLLEDALKAARRSLPEDVRLDYNNDGLIDNLVFVVGGAPDGWDQILWPHRRALQQNKVYLTDATGEDKQGYSYNMVFSSVRYAGTGVLAHEFLHTLGFPDLYRYENSGTPVGAWDVMGTNDQSDPQLPGSYLREKYAGWCTLETVNQSGTYTLEALGTDSGTPDGYRIPTGNPNEFLVAEYRKNGTYGNILEDNVPGDGLLLYRVDLTSRGNENGSMKGGDEVYVYRPEDFGVNYGTSTKLSKAALRGDYDSLGSAGSALPVQQTLYLHNGINTRVVVDQVRENADGTLSFRVTLPEDENVVPPSAEGEAYDLSRQDYTISRPGEYRFTGTTDAHGITVSGDVKDVQITFTGVRMNLSSTDYGAPVYLRQGAQAKLTLEGENLLRGGRYEAAVHVGGGASLTLNGPGSLEAYGGAGASAIGGNAFEPAGNITVQNCTVKAVGGGEYTVTGPLTSISGGSAPAIGGGNSQRGGNILLNNAVVKLEATGAAALSTSALSGSGKVYRKGGDVRIDNSTVEGNGALWAGGSLTAEDSSLTLRRAGPGESGCLEAEQMIALTRCATVLESIQSGSAMGGYGRNAGIEVRGGTLRALSADYTICGGSVSFDDTAEVFLGTGKTETLFSGYLSGEEPLLIQPGLPLGADGRALLLQGTLESPLTGEEKFSLYRDTQKITGFSLFGGGLTFALSVPSAGSYSFQNRLGGETGAVPVGNDGVTRARPLQFAFSGAGLPELDVSGGSVSITESGAYLLRGACAKGAVALGENLQVTLHLGGVDLTGPSNNAAISVGKGTALTIVADSGTENRLEGGRGRAAVVSPGAVALEGDGSFTAIGGAGDGGITAGSFTVERG